MVQLFKALAHPMRASIVYRLISSPADVTELPAGAGAKDDLGVGAVVLTGDSGVKGYYGANPPAGHGPHRYIYIVHAVDVPALDIPEDASPAVLGFNLHFHALGRAVLWGWYEESE